MNQADKDKVISALSQAREWVDAYADDDDDVMAEIVVKASDEAMEIMRGVAAEPVGWKRVPIEPTPEMCQSGGKAMFTASWESEDAEAADIYSAMLKAAPEAP